MGSMSPDIPKPKEYQETKTPVYNDADAANNTGRRGTVLTPVTGSGTNTVLSTGAGQKKQLLGQ